MPILYKCSAKGCSKILEVQGLCNIHQAKYDKANKIRVSNRERRCNVMELSKIMVSITLDVKQLQRDIQESIKKNVKVSM